MTRCLILAAGEGTRLRPLTNNIPKALVPLLGKPLIAYQIETLQAAGIQNIALATGYEAKKLQALGHPTFHNPQYAETNMVESLFAARAFFEQAQTDLLISYGDIVYQKNNLEAVLKTNADIAVMIDDNWLKLWSARNENPLEDAETLKLSSNGNIIEIGKKPHSLDEIESQYTGLIKISRHKIAALLSFYDNLDRTKDHARRPFQKMYMTDFLQLLIDTGWILQPAHVRSGWLEIDTVEDLQLYERLAKSSELNTLWRADE